MKFDIIIIGAGPAGLLAAWCLEGTGISYTVIEKGNVYFKRDKELPYDVRLWLRWSGSFFGW
ncbi:MAG: NAD(P)-binding domain-containing protein [Roseburia hominis]